MLELSLNLLDLTQNSITAGAKLITISITEDDAFLTLSIQDDGCGMTEEFARRVTDPFTTTRTTRKVGFGLPFILQLCEMTGGNLSLESEVGVGTVIRASMGIHHIDRPPLGDVADTMLSLIVPNESIDFLFTYKTKSGEYALDTRELREVLDGMSFQHPDVILWLQANLAEGLAELNPVA